MVDKKSLNFEELEHVLIEKVGFFGTCSRTPPDRMDSSDREESLKIKELEHVLIEKVERLFRGMLESALELTGI